MNGLRVLVVDDNAVARAMVSRAVKTSGLPVQDIREAPNGRDALRVIQGGDVDLALVDIHMPEMPGDELIRTLRGSSDTSALPIIAVSSDCSEGLAEFLHDHNVPRVPKPFEPEELRQLIVHETGVEDDYDYGKDDLEDNSLDF